MAIDALTDLKERFICQEFRNGFAHFERHFCLGLGVK
jgi:hypothetical protein